MAKKEEEEKPCFAYLFRKFKTLLQDSFSWHTPTPSLTLYVCENVNLSMNSFLSSAPMNIFFPFLCVVCK